jgi:hypothetical protein
MTIEHRAVTLLRVCLVGLFVVLIPFETLSLPGQFAHLAKESPEDAYLRWPATAVTIFWVVCVQVVIVATWRLLSLVRADRIFSEVSFTWVDVIIGAIAAAWVSLAAVWVYIGFHADDPGILVLLFLVLACLGVLGLLMIVMRALLRRATTLRTDLDGVI